MISAWISDVYSRIYTNTKPQNKKLLKLEGALNERFSFQCAFQSDSESNASFNVNGDSSFKTSIEANAPAGWHIRIRSVGYVPVKHRNTMIPLTPLHFEGLENIPGYVPDPLFDFKDGDRITSSIGETNTFWLTVVPPENATPGKYKVKVVIKSAFKEELEKIKPVELCSEITLHNLTLAPRKNFRVTHWFYIDSIMDWYKTEGFDENFWKLLEVYLKDLSEHGQDVIYVPVFTPPLDGVKRPSQLLKVKKTGKCKYSFDWSDVRKYVRLAKKSGIEFFEWSHIATQWGAKFAIRIYEGQGEGEKLVFDPKLPATDTAYKKFLIQYLGELHDFLKKEKIFSKSYFHLSDEPHGEEHLANYRKMRAMLNEIAPWMKIMDALSQVKFAEEKLTDLPVPSISEVLKFIEAGIKNFWCYYCCGPKGKYLNHFLDTPLAKVAMHGFLFYRWPIQGFLHWGYNYWYKSQTRKLIDPFIEQAGEAFGNWAYGDTFLVYPGDSGPIDSIRWELFAEAMNDYRLLQTLQIDRNDKILDLIKDFDNFPMTAEWRLKMRARLFKAAAKKLK